MTFAYLFPALIAIAGLVVAGSIHRDLPPRATAFVLTGAIVATAATTIWSITLLAADLLLDRFGWCRETLQGHIHVPVLLGAGALATVGCGAVSVVRSLARHHRARRGPMPDGDLFVIEAESPTAFAVPGRHPHVVVSTGMLELLDADEQRAMLAHERAHLRHHHHRLIIATEVAASLLPLLWLPARKVRFATERWADQDATREVGDANIVARAIARAALARSDAVGTELAISGSDVTARIEALTGDGDCSRVAASSLGDC
jgi:Zn-dependent protease with chaperone function